MDRMKEFSSGTGTKDQTHSYGNITYVKIQGDEAVEFRPCPTLDMMGMTTFMFGWKQHKFWGGKGNQLNRSFACMEAFGEPKGSCAACNNQREHISPYLERVWGALEGFGGSEFNRRMEAMKAAKDLDNSAGGKIHFDKFKEVQSMTSPFFGESQWLIPGVNRKTSGFEWLRFSTGKRGLKPIVLTAMKHGLSMDQSRDLLSEFNALSKGAQENWLFDKFLHMELGYDWALSHPGGESTVWSCFINATVSTPLVDPGNQALDSEVSSFFDQLIELPVDTRPKFLYHYDPPNRANLEKWSNELLDHTGLRQASGGSVSSSASTATTTTNSSTTPPAAAAESQDVPDNIGF